MEKKSITPADQIKDQQETIDRLTKTVTKLENELEKCLSPGVDSKKNQAAPPPLFKDGVMEKRLYTGITAALLPICLKNQTTDKRENNHHAWWYFRDFLVNVDLFDQHWSNKNFRYGIDLLNDLCQAGEDRPTALEGFDKYETGYRFFGYGSEGDEKKRIGIKALIEAMHIVRANQDYEGIKGMIDMDDMNNMLIALMLIEAHQRIWSEAREIE